MTDPGSGWSHVGSYQTSSGVAVSEDGALALTALSCGIRVISETLASLPCNLLEQQDYRTTRKATSHPLWPLVHDQPNDEQDVMLYMDSQVSAQVGWGNAYAEIQRNTIGEIVALWPIHPSRIPNSHILRNPRDPGDWQDVTVGQPGELVYYVRSDDGTCTPIAASDMLHVPGVLSRNGITGRSIVQLGRNAIGIAMATEEHAGAFFKNGANPNIALKHPKTVGKETADRLRASWQSVFGGVKNHYKALLLEEGMDAVPFTMSPENSQLVLSRQFSVTEIARLLRLPPHMLMDLTRATFSNIEAQGLELIVYSLMPWIVRWEKAMYRQLLTLEEKKKYRFKFNVMGLLRGDQAARSAFYQSMFNMGAFSPNDILELEDRNPIEGGDQRFVPRNNLAPLDKISEIVQAELDKLKAPPPPRFPPPVKRDDEPLPDNRLGAIQTAIEQIIPGVNLRAADAAAQREAKADEAIASVCCAIRLAIEGEARQLMQYESRAAKDAAKKPETFLAWRDKFYPEFTAKLTAAISVFVPAANAVGVAIDGGEAAAAYVAESITEFDPLLDLPMNEFTSKLNGLSETWAERPARLAAEIMKGTAA